MGSSPRTLVIASVASAAAALLVSELWVAGTWIAAALTPVIVTLVSELLNRPTARIARSLTSARESPPAARGPGSEAPVRVYRSGASDPPSARPGTGGPTQGAAGPRSRRRKIAYGAVFGTAALAFVIAVIAVTVPELVAGGSAGGDDGGTTFFQGENDNSDREPDSQKPQDRAPDDEAKPEEQQEEEQPTTPTEQRPTSPDEEQPTTPTQETPTEETPAPGEPLPRTVQPTDQP
jgi:hypothetical protein